MSRPMLISGTDPVYTKAALAAGVAGLIIARCVITATGVTTSCKIIKSLPLMDQAVLTALHSRRYTPVVHQGKFVAVHYVFSVRLVLPAQPPPSPPRTPGASP
jgi:protein TonB